MATRRRRFTAAFKKRVAPEALRGEQPVQAIAAKHQVHPNQVSAWKRQAVGGPGRGVFGPAVEGSFGARGDDPGASREDR